MDKVFKYLGFIFLSTIMLTSCSLTQITKGKVKRNEELINEVSKIILEERITKLNVRKVEKSLLKKKLKKLNVWNVKVHFNKDSYGMDSIIVMSKMSGFLRDESIIVDFSKQNRDLSKISGLKVHDRIYYRTFIALM